MPYNQKQKEASDRYAREHLEQIQVRVPIGERKALQDAAAERGQSMRQLIAEAVNKLVGREILTVTDGQRGRKPRKNEQR